MGCGASSGGEGEEQYKSSKKYESTLAGCVEEVNDVRAELPIDHPAVYIAHYRLAEAAAKACKKSNVKKTQNMLRSQLARAEATIQDPNEPNSVMYANARKPLPKAAFADLAALDEVKEMGVANLLDFWSRHLNEVSADDAVKGLKKKEHNAASESTVALAKDGAAKVKEEPTQKEEDPKKTKPKRAAPKKGDRTVMENDPEYAEMRWEVSGVRSKRGIEWGAPHFLDEAKRKTDAGTQLSHGNVRGSCLALADDGTLCVLWADRNQTLKSTSRGVDGMWNTGAFAELSTGKGAHKPHIFTLTGGLVVACWTENTLVAEKSGMVRCAVRSRASPHVWHQSVDFVVDAEQLDEAVPCALPDNGIAVAYESNGAVYCVTGKVNESGSEYAFAWEPTERISNQFTSGKNLDPCPRLLGEGLWVTYQHDSSIFYTTRDELGDWSPGKDDHGSQIKYEDGNGELQVQKVSADPNSVVSGTCEDGTAVLTSFLPEIDGATDGVPVNSNGVVLEVTIAGAQATVKADDDISADLPWVDSKKVTFPMIAGHGDEVCLVWNEEKYHGQGISQPQGQTSRIGVSWRQRCNAPWDGPWILEGINQAPVRLPRVLLTADHIYLAHIEYSKSKKTDEEMEKLYVRVGKREEADRNLADSGEDALREDFGSINVEK